MLTALAPPIPEMVQGGHLDLREWTERKRVQDLVELGRASEIEDADVCVFAGDAPHTLPLTLQMTHQDPTCRKISHRFRRLLRDCMSQDDQDPLSEQAGIDAIRGSCCLSD